MVVIGLHERLSDYDLTIVEKKNLWIVKIFGSFQKSLIKKKRDERRPNIVFEMCSVPRKTGVLFVCVFVF